MLWRYLLVGAALVSAAGIAEAQVGREPQPLAPAPAARLSGAASKSPANARPDQSTSGTAAKWRVPGTAIRANAESPVGGQPPLQPAAGGAARPPIARVTKGPDSLPNDGGQEWRDYDISPYTARVTSTNRPEQAILDWILRETGYETWHTQPLAVLSIDNRRLRVYHTPEVHAVVADMVDRFVNTEAESQAFGMRIITVGSPNWRAKSHRILHPVPTQTQGVQAWLLAKEDAPLLVADLSRRSDFQEHSTPHLLVNNGQSKQVSAMRPRNYVRDVISKPTDPWPGFEPQMAQFDEGFKLEFNPLLSLDGRVVDAVINCEVDQIEKMIPITIDVPTAVVPKQHTKIEVPQPIASRLHERFRWPADQVLLISLGVGPAPVPAANNGLGLSVPLISSPARTELLVFVENKGKVASQPAATQPGQPQAGAYRDRY